MRIARRTLVFAMAGMIAGGLSFPGNAVTQHDENQAPPVAPPFATIGPVAGYENTVAFFFAFTCPYCRDYDVHITRWGATLPEQFTFKRVPLVVSEADIPMARAYFAVSLIDPSLEAIAASRLYVFAAQSPVLPPSSFKRFALFWDIFKDLGFTRERYAAAFGHEHTMAALIEAHDSAVGHRLTHTPSLGIVGRYLVSPATTNGDYKAFFSVANGLLSQQIRTTAL